MTLRAWVTTTTTPTAGTRDWPTPRRRRGFLSRWQLLCDGVRGLSPPLNKQPVIRRLVKGVSLGTAVPFAQLSCVLRILGQISREV